jgi:hypothetical protein
MSEPSNPNSPWRTLPTITPTKVSDDPYDEVCKIPTTKEQRDYARRRLARIDALRLQQRKRSRAN